jgi:hypothetical protein
MDLKTLRERGGIVPSAPVKREVTWKHVTDDLGEVTDTFTVHIRRLSCGTIDRIRAAARSVVNGNEPEFSERALIISGSVLLGDDGSERISYEVADSLDPALAEALIDACNAVNGGEVAPKN